MPNRMLKIILLAASSDSKLDNYEKVFLEKILTGNPEFYNLSINEIGQIQQSLISDLQRLEVEEIVESEARFLSSESKLKTYALCLEMCLYNFELDDLELIFLRMLRRILNLNPADIDSIHFSATVRYGLTEPF